MQGLEFDEEEWEKVHNKPERVNTNVGMNKGVLELVPTLKSMKGNTKIKVRKEFKEDKVDKMPKHLYSGKMSNGTRAWR